MSIRDQPSQKQHYNHTHTHTHTLTVFALIYFILATRDYYQIWPSQHTHSHPHSPPHVNGDGVWLVKVFVMVDVPSTLLPFSLSIIYHTFMPHRLEKPVLLVC